MRRRPVFGIAALGLGLVAAAPAAVAAPPQACPFVTSAQAQTILAASVGPGREGDVLDISTSCVFTDPTGKLSLTVSFLDPDSLSAPAPDVLATFAQERPGAAPVAGLGDGAFSATQTTGGLIESDVFANFQGSVLEVGAVGSANPNVGAALIRQAKQILGVP